jgi:hypothetical protein
MEKKYEKPKDMATALDCAIRFDEMKDGGYVMDGKNITYCNYMTNDDWKEFCNTMKASHKKQYGNGSGGEMKEGQYPPKMASFGSSSRLVYKRSCDIEGFSFEEKLDTRVGGTANLDGFLRKDSEYIYVEAKMREIYGGSHANEEISEAYLPVYDKIKEKCEAFSYTQADCDKKGYKKITFVVNKENVLHFDLKQVICHFLGITYDLAKHAIKSPNVKFVYLLYNPYRIETCLDVKYQQQVLNRYDEVHDFINDKIEQNFFNCIFDAILDYQTENHHLDKPNIKFEMKLLEQGNYREVF